MNRSVKIALAVFLLALAANLYIYRNRNNGYEYLNPKTYEELYPCCDSTNSTMRKWYRCMDIYAPAEVKAAAAYSDTAFGIAAADDAGTKVNKLLYAMHAMYEGNRRLLDQSEHAYANTLQRFRIYHDSGYKINGVAYTDFLHFFARSNGVLVRYVHSTGHMVEHIFNEVFLPEKKKWVYADINAGIAHMRDSVTGELINCADLMRAVDSGRLNRLQIRFIGDSLYHPADTLRQFFTYYFAGTNTLFYYYTINLGKVYRLKDKLLHYFTRASWHETYTHLPVSNRKFYVKQAVAVAGLVSFLVLVFLAGRSLLHYRRRPVS